MTKTIRTTRGKEMQEILAATVVTKEIPEYYGGKRVRPGELPHVQNPGISSPYSEKAKELTMRYLVQLEVRKLETHPLLLVPGWTGFNIKVRDPVVIAEGTISYLDTLDSPAIDLKTACEVLSPGCEIKGQMQFGTLFFCVCVFDQAFLCQGHGGVLEMQGAICWPSHSEGSFSFVDNVLRSNWKTIWGCRSQRASCPERCYGITFFG